MSDLAARSLRVALSGCVQSDDPHIIAGMMGEIERMTRENGEIDAELSHYINLACVDPGANSRVFWIDRAKAAEAQVETLRAALQVASRTILNALHANGENIDEADAEQRATLRLIEAALSSLPAPSRGTPELTGGQMLALERVAAGHKPHERARRSLESMGLVRGDTLTDAGHAALTKMRAAAGDVCDQPRSPAPERNREDGAS